MCTDNPDEARSHCTQTFELQQDLCSTSEWYAVYLLLDQWPSGSFDSTASLLAPASGCSYCKKETELERSCDSCERRRYCSSECYAQHRRTHQIFCADYAANDRTHASHGSKEDREPTRKCGNDHWVLYRPLSASVHIRCKRQACYSWKVFASLAIATRPWDVHQCLNADCQARRALLDTAAPGCEWASFRELVLTLFSCSTHASAAIFLTEVGLILQAPFGQEHLRLSRYPCFDIFGVIRLWRWAYRFHNGPWLDPIISCCDFKGHELQYPDATRVLRERGICPSRLWNLTLQNWDASIHVEQLLRVVLTFPDKRSIGARKHLQCTQQLCLHDQENSTRIQQAHKCETSACGSLSVFPPETLNDIYANSDLHTWRQSAWSIEQPQTLCSAETRFIALSHVWSDGTGTGPNGQGRVNKCLHEFFMKFAKELNCQGIWWDAVCMPTARDQRSKAMNVMLQNYERATYTVVHDEELAQTEWREDGSPALALALSSWFTRGWTAAELYASRGHPVKVIFSQPGTGRPILKDLDRDILVEHCVQSGEMYDRFHATFRERPQALQTVPCRLLPTLSHFIASDIVRQLRPDVEDEEDVGLSGVTFLRTLIRILNARSTSWQRDKLLIAGLLCLPKFSFDSTASSVEVTQQILKQQEMISVPNLLHGSATIAETGPWSWCPPSIFDFAQSFTSTLLGFYNNARVTADGLLDCSTFFQITALQQDEQLMPLGLHPSVTRRILLAQTQWKKCILLSPLTTEEDLGECILAYAIRPMELKNSLGGLGGVRHRVGTTINYLACRWIGCVRARLRSREYLQGWNIVFGADVDESGNALPPVDAEPLFSRAGRIEHDPAFPFGPGTIEELDDNVAGLNIDTAGDTQAG